MTGLSQELCHLHGVQLTIASSMGCHLSCGVPVVSVDLLRSISGIIGLNDLLWEGMSLLGISGSLHIFMFSHMIN